MKLLIVMGVEATEPTIRELMRNAGVLVYSESSIQGIRMSAAVADASNWFGSSKASTYSVMSFAFVPAQQADALLKSVTDHNSQYPTAYPLHAFQLAVEASV